MNVFVTFAPEGQEILREFGGKDQPLFVSRVKGSLLKHFLGHICWW